MHSKKSSVNKKMYYFIFYLIIEVSIRLLEHYALGKTLDLLRELWTIFKSWF